MPTLYHYVHCPFCIRIRLACGLLNVQYQSQVLPYDDEKTPLALIDKKMLPIWQDKGITSNESLDIIKHIDPQQKLYQDAFDYQKIEPLLKDLGASVHPLAMPYWVYTYEFNHDSRAYFLKKQEQKKGSFKELFKNQNQYLTTLSPKLKDLEEKLSPYFMSNEINLYDILLASHLWGLYIVPEFQFSTKMHAYLQDIKKACHFDYHKDFWEK